MHVNSLLIPNLNLFHVATLFRKNKAIKYCIYLSDRGTSCILDEYHYKVFLLQVFLGAVLLGIWTLGVLHTACTQCSVYGLVTGSAHSPCTGSSHNLDTGSVYGMGTGSAHVLDTGSAHGLDIVSAHTMVTGSAHGLNTGSFTHLNGSISPAVCIN